jgi:hypothetical protein
MRGYKPAKIDADSATIDRLLAARLQIKLSLTRFLLHSCKLKIDVRARKKTIILLFGFVAEKVRVARSTTDKSVYLDRVSPTSCARRARRGSIFPVK